MGRRIAGAVLDRTLPPHAWPDWVLVFPRGVYPDDKARQAETVREFHAWRRARDAWRRDHTDLSAPAFQLAAGREQRRRAV